MRDGKISTEEYQKLKGVDIREIDPAAAADIRGITVNPDLSPAERLLDVARQMNGNPFVYRHGFPPVSVGRVPGKVLRRPTCGTIQLRPVSQAA